ncbi:hypothetical protein [uncultured Mediterranean phage uvMED]|jgi:hypothetical protein|nr:hypothetical protein [uncultured Mediterranean phage uvMED]BAQ84836.1 hypothetical protein [uncultured Mediterranean phage uvMED]BAQ84879.1 hypothetical protein [uncultured Mediterranean phage uvMED]BAR13799.1 hypothetical protein [uncultured Mediterranean phage uvMED]BAR14842.1 hypothetical protein [uncultured Mediterranean phage uvMED]
MNRLKRLFILWRHDRLSDYIFKKKIKKQGGLSKELLESLEQRENE